ncbi:MAG: ABC transporter permease [Peptococcaceae bacterium]|nr:ABC transporter permease [Peptococcaceae bacterium]
MQTPTTTDSASQTHQVWLLQHKREKQKITAVQILLLITLLAVWELAARMGWIDTFLFSSPGAIVEIFWIYFSNGTIWAHIGITMWETFVGFLIGTFCGIAIAVMLWWWPVLSRILDPFLVVMNALPKTALAPIVIVWFGAGLTGIIAVAVSICIVVTIISAYTDFRSVDADKIRMLESFGATKGQILRKLVLPANRDNMLSLAKINMGLCLIGVIVGEFLVSRSGIGYLIVYGSQVFRLDLVMMGVVILAVCAWILNSLINLLERHIKKS